MAFAGLYGAPMASEGLSLGLQNAASEVCPGGDRPAKILAGFASRAKVYT